MKLISFKKNGNKVHVRMLLSNEEFEDKVNRVWNYQKKWFKIPGFRKGKVPRKVIENEYGENVFYRSALDLFYPGMIDFIIKETGEEIIKIEGELYMSISYEAKPEIVKKDEEGVEVELSANVYPKIDIDYKSMVIEVNPKRIASEKDIENHIKLMQRRMGLKSMEKDVKVEDGDLVKIDVASASLLDENGNVDTTDKMLKGLQNAKGIKLRASSETDGSIDKALIGHCIGDDFFDVEVSFPEGHKLSGKSARLSIKIDTLARLHSLEEVAKENNCETVDDLKELAKKAVNDIYERDFENEKKQALSEALASKVSDEYVPSDILDAEIKIEEGRIRKELNLKESQDIYSVIESNTGIKADEVKDTMLKLIKSKLKNLIAIHSVADKESLSINEENIKSVSAKLASSGIPSGIMSKVELENVALADKVVNFLIDKVKFVDKIVKDGENSGAKVSDGSSNEVTDIKNESGD